MKERNAPPQLWSRSAAGILIIRWLRDVLPDAPGLLLPVHFPPWLPLRYPRRHSGRWALALTT